MEILRLGEGGELARPRNGFSMIPSTAWDPDERGSGLWYSMSRGLGTEVTADGTAGSVEQVLKEMFMGIAARYQCQIGTQRVIYDSVHVYLSVAPRPFPDRTGANYQERFSSGGSFRNLCW